MADGLDHEAVFEIIRFHGLTGFTANFPTSLGVESQAALHFVLLGVALETLGFQDGEDLFREELVGIVVLISTVGTQA